MKYSVYNIKATVYENNSMNIRRSGGENLKYTTVTFLKHTWSGIINLNVDKLNMYT